MKRNTKVFRAIAILFAFLVTFAGSCNFPGFAEETVTAPEIATLQAQLDRRIAEATLNAQIAELEAAIAAVGSTPTLIPPTAMPQFPTQSWTPVPDYILKHLAYWTTATPRENWPNLAEMTIVAAHGDPDQSGNATVIFYLKGYRPIEASSLTMIYFNGYTGPWNDASKAQIIREVEESVQPHVPGFRLTNAQVVQLP